MRLRIPILLVLALASIPAPAEAGERRRICEAADWAWTPGDDLDVDPRLRALGVEPAELAAVEPHWEGDMLFTGDSLGASALAQLGLPPLPAMEYESAPGILYVAMQGVTLSPFCGNGDSANAALNCSPLVDVETNFPSYGGAGEQGAVFQQLQSYYADFNLVMSTNRPPDFVPYTMAVIGGASTMGGACGVANVACDGLKRNHVSLTWPQSCGGVADIAAQETSHNWGLEHVDESVDLMYPFNNGGYKEFVDSCNAINHDTGNGVTQCGYIHELYCPAGGGEQQNSYAELMGVFGPRAQDSTPPEIVEITPADGTVFTTMDGSLTVSAMVTEDTPFLGARWSWLEGLPPDMESYTRCTNNVCDADYNVGVGFDPDEVVWDFVSFDLATTPPGVYAFRFEIMDAYGNADSAEISIEVIEGAASAGTSSASGADGTGDGSGDGSAEGEGEGEGEGEAGTSGGGTGLTGLSGETGDGGGGKDCACRADARPPATLLLFVAAALRRRRARA
jgi:hypothetical protein